MKYANKRFLSNPGSPVHVLYAPKVNADGSIDLVESGYENTYDYIQSFERSTDLSVILTRISAGETQLLYQRPGSFGDFTKMPGTYAEALQLQIDSNNLFKSLPVDVKNKFDNDPSKFFAQSGTKEWFEKIEVVLPKEVKDLVKPSDPATSDLRVEVKE